MVCCVALLLRSGPTSCSKNVESGLRMKRSDETEQSRCSIFQLCSFQSILGGQVNHGSAVLRSSPASPPAPPRSVGKMSIYGGKSAYHRRRGVGRVPPATPPPTRINHQPSTISITHQHQAPVLPLSQPHHNVRSHRPRPQMHAIAQMPRCKDRLIRDERSHGNRNECPDPSTPRRGRNYIGYSMPANTLRSFSLLASTACREARPMIRTHSFASLGLEALACQPPSHHHMCQIAGKGKPGKGGVKG